ncbi:hypothetical protein [Clostridium tepidiprofundi]|nr:hypothetical protein [Clostridium tepidiprofundi]
MKKSILVFLLITILILSNACTKQQSKDKKENITNAQNQKAVVYCDESVLAMVKDLVFVYNSNNKNNIAYNVLRREDAFAKLNSGEKCILLGYMSDCDKKDKNIKQDVIAYEGIAIVVDSGSLINNITTVQLREIYSGKKIYVKDLISNSKTGNIDTEQLNTLVRPLAYNGNMSLESYFRSQVMNMPTKLSYGSDVKYVSNVHDMKGNIKNSFNIGYVNLQNYDTGLKMLLVDGVKLVRGTLESELYPLRIPINIFYNSENEDALEDFNKFLKSDSSKAIIRKYCIQAF